MQLTKAGEYAIRSLVYLAMQSTDARIMASEVAESEDIPVNFVRKILESLAKSGLVKSYRGAGGGFTLGRPPELISLCNVIEAIEGPFAINECLTLNGCSRKPFCSVSPVWEEVQDSVKAILSRYSLEDVVQETLRRKNKEMALIN